MKAADLRAEVARHGVKIYELAPRVGLHPATLGQVLNERRPLTSDLADRIAGALRGLKHQER
jgi:plasmid maintenance system antidote protein VapI